MKKLFAIPAFIFFVVSCDKIDDPFEQKPDTNNGLNLSYDTVLSLPNGPNRYILLEEFTGHTCTNCPDGTKEVIRLDSIYGIQLIPVAIHAGVFAVPQNNTDGSYATDFRINAGETYFTTFDVWGNPSAMVSRKESGGNYVLPKGSWESTITSIKNDPAKLKIDILNLYNDSLRYLKSKATISWLSTTAGNYKVQFYLVEDKITDWQLDGSFNNPNYLHRHALRAVLNGAWGTSINSSNQGDTATFEYIITLNNNWNADNCEIVVFVYESASYEVIQANEAHVK
jgi:hypothetical protein